ncbi:hypothetical protein AB0C77_15990 [Streptomyces sp. NPDC048629]|uniref:hypothetical protein n=1 Tax=Streptomyces sp. NPDC048629 TaxID=3154824 RepID=UPI00343E24F9
MAERVLGPTDGDRAARTHGLLLQHSPEYKRQFDYAAAVAQSAQGSRQVAAGPVGELVKRFGLHPSTADVWLNHLFPQKDVVQPVVTDLTADDDQDPRPNVQAASQVPHPALVIAQAELVKTGGYGVRAQNVAAVMYPQGHGRDHIAQIADFLAQHGIKPLTDDEYRVVRVINRARVLGWQSGQVKLADLHDYATLPGEAKPNTATEHLMRGALAVVGSPLGFRKLSIGGYGNSVLATDLFSRIRAAHGPQPTISAVLSTLFPAKPATDPLAGKTISGWRTAYWMLTEAGETTELERAKEAAFQQARQQLRNQGEIDVRSLATTVLRLTGAPSGAEQRMVETWLREEGLLRRVYPKGSAREALEDLRRRPPVPPSPGTTWNTRLDYAAHLGIWFARTGVVNYQDYTEHMEPKNENGRRTFVDSALQAVGARFKARVQGMDVSTAAQMQRLIDTVRASEPGTFDLSTTAPEIYGHLSQGESLRLGEDRARGQLRALGLHGGPIPDKGPRRLMVRAAGEFAEQLRAQHPGEPVTAAEVAKLLWDVPEPDDFQVVVAGELVRQAEEARQRDRDRPPHWTRRLQGDEVRLRERTVQHAPSVFATEDRLARTLDEVAADVLPRGATDRAVHMHWLLVQYDDRYRAAFDEALTDAHQTPGNNGQDPTARLQSLLAAHQLDPSTLHVWLDQIREHADYLAAYPTDAPSEHRRFLSEVSAELEAQGARPPVPESDSPSLRMLRDLWLWRALKPLHGLKDVVDVTLLGEFFRTEVRRGPNVSAHQAEARRIVDGSMLFPMTLGDHGEGLLARSPLEYWTQLAVAQVLASGGTDPVDPQTLERAYELAESIRQDRGLPQPVARVRGGTLDADDTQVTEPPTDAWQRYLLGFEEQGDDPPSGVHAMDWDMAEMMVRETLGGRNFFEASEGAAHVTAGHRLLLETVPGYRDDFEQYGAAYADAVRAGEDPGLALDLMAGLLELSGPQARYWRGLFITASDDDVDMQVVDTSDVDMPDVDTSEVALLDVDMLDVDEEPMAWQRYMDGIDARQSNSTEPDAVPAAVKELIEDSALFGGPAVSDLRDVHELLLAHSEEYREDFDAFRLSYELAMDQGQEPAPALAALGADLRLSDAQTEYWRSLMTEESSELAPGQEDDGLEELVQEVVAHGWESSAQASFGASAEDVLRRMQGSADALGEEQVAQWLRDAGIKVLTPEDHTAATAITWVRDATTVGDPDTLDEALESAFGLAKDDAEADQLQGVLEVAGLVPFDQEATDGLTRTDMLSLADSAGRGQAARTGPFPSHRATGWARGLRLLRDAGEQTVLDSAEATVPDGAEATVRDGAEQRGTAGPRTAEDVVQEELVRTGGFGVRAADLARGLHPGGPTDEQIREASDWLTSHEYRVLSDQDYRAARALTLFRSEKRTGPMRMERLSKDVEPHGTEKEPAYKKQFLSGVLDIAGASGNQLAMAIGTRANMLLIVDAFERSLRATISPPVRDLIETLLPKHLDRTDRAQMASGWTKGWQLLHGAGQPSELEKAREQAVAMARDQLARLGHVRLDEIVNSVLKHTREPADKERRLVETWLRERGVLGLDYPQGSARAKLEEIRRQPPVPPGEEASTEERMDYAAHVALWWARTGTVSAIEYRDKFLGHSFANREHTVLANGVFQGIGATGFPGGDTATIAAQLTKSIAAARNAAPGMLNHDTTAPTIYGTKLKNPRLHVRHMQGHLAPLGWVDGAIPQSGTRWVMMRAAGEFADQLRTEVGTEGSVSPADVAKLLYAVSEPDDLKIAVTAELMRQAEESRTANAGPQMILPVNSAPAATTESTESTEATEATEMNETIGSTETTEGTARPVVASPWAEEQMLQIAGTEAAKTGYGVRPMDLVRALQPSGHSRQDLVYAADWLTRHGFRVLSDDQYRAARVLTQARELRSQGKTLNVASLVPLTILPGETKTPTRPECFVNAVLTLAGLTRIGEYAKYGSYSKLLLVTDAIARFHAGGSHPSTGAVAMHFHPNVANLRDPREFVKGWRETHRMMTESGEETELERARRTAIDLAGQQLEDIGAIDPPALTVSLMELDRQPTRQELELVESWLREEGLLGPVPPWGSAREALEFVRRQPPVEPPEDATDEERLDYAAHVGLWNARTPILDHTELLSRVTGPGGSALHNANSGLLQGAGIKVSVYRRGENQPTAAHMEESIRKALSVWPDVINQTEAHEIYDGVYKDPYAALRRVKAQLLPLGLYGDPIPAHGTRRLMVRAAGEYVEQLRKDRPGEPVTPLDVAKLLYAITDPDEFQVVVVAELMRQAEEERTRDREQQDERRLRERVLQHAESVFGIGEQLPRTLSELADDVLGGRAPDRVVRTHWLLVRHSDRYRAAFEQGLALTDGFESGPLAADRVHELASSLGLHPSTAQVWLDQIAEYGRFLAAYPLDAGNDEVAFYMAVTTELEAQGVRPPVLPSTTRSLNMLHDLWLWRVVKPLQDLSAVVDTRALKGFFGSGEHDRLGLGRRLKARRIVDASLLFPLTIGDHGEGLLARSPLEYWTTMAVLQVLSTGGLGSAAEQSAARLAETVREQLGLPRPLRRRGGARPRQDETDEPGIDTQADLSPDSTSSTSSAASSRDASNARPTKVTLPSLITDWTTHDSDSEGESSQLSTDNSVFLSPFSPHSSGSSQQGDYFGFSPISRRSSEELLVEHLRGLSIRRGSEHLPTVEEVDEPRPHAASIPPVAAEKGWGMPVANQLRFQSVSDRHNVVIDVRPTNVEAVRWLNEGALPKPQEIKAKTINELDTYLGAPAQKQGLVAFFQPTLPDRLPEDRQLAAWIAKRFAQRRKEYQALLPEMNRLVSSGRYQVDPDGLVLAVDHQGDTRPLTGDHDIFDMRRADTGQRVPVSQYEAIVEEMMDADMGVMHGALKYWEPVDEFGRQVYDTIVGAHQPDGEALIRFAPRKNSTVAFDGSEFFPGALEEDASPNLHQPTAQEPDATPAAELEILGRRAEQRLLDLVDKEHARWEATDPEAREPEPRLTRQQLHDEMLPLVASLVTGLDLPERAAQGLKWIVAETLWSKGPGPALRHANTLLAAYILGDQLEEDAFAQRMDEARAVLDEHNPSWADLPSEEYRARLLDATLAVHTRGRDAAVDLARAKEQRVKGSAGPERFTPRSMDTGHPLAKVINLMPSRAQEADAAAWARHTPDSHARFVRKQRTQDGQDIIAGTAALPWAGELTLYVDLHGRPDHLLSAPSDPRLGLGKNGLVPTSPAHLATLLSGLEDFTDLLEFAERTGRVLNVVLFACESDADLGQLSVAAEEFAQALAHRRITVHSSAKELGLNENGTIWVEAAPQEAAWEVHAPEPVDHAEITWDESAFEGAHTFRSTADTPLRHTAVPSHALKQQLALVRQSGVDEVHLIDGPRHGELIKAYAPDDHGAETHRTLTMPELADALVDLVPENAALVYTVNSGAIGPVLEHKEGRAPVRGDAPAQLLADARQQPVVAAWGTVFQDHEDGGEARVLRVAPPPEIPEGAVWQPWVTFWPRPSEGAASGSAAESSQRRDSDTAVSQQQPLLRGARPQSSFAVAEPYREPTPEPFEAPAESALAELMELLAEPWPAPGPHSGEEERLDYAVHRALNSGTEGTVTPAEYALLLGRPIQDAGDEAEVMGILEAAGLGLVTSGTWPDHGAEHMRGLFTAAHSLLAAGPGRELDPYLPAQGPYQWRRMKGRLATVGLLGDRTPGGLRDLLARAVAELVAEAREQGRDPDVVDMARRLYRTRTAPPTLLQLVVVEELVRQAEPGTNLLDFTTSRGSRGGGRAREDDSMSGSGSDSDGPSQQKRVRFDSPSDDTQDDESMADTEPEMETESVSEHESEDESMADTEPEMETESVSEHESEMEIEYESDRDSEHDSGAGDELRLAERQWQQYLESLGPEAAQRRWLNDVMRRETRAREALRDEPAYDSYLRRLFALSQHDPDWSTSSRAKQMYREFALTLSLTPDGLNRTAALLGEILNPAKPLTEDEVYALLDDVRGELGPRELAPGEHARNGFVEPVASEIEEAGLTVWQDIGLLTRPATYVLRSWMARWAEPAAYEEEDPPDRDELARRLFGPEEVHGPELVNRLLSDDPYTEVLLTGTTKVRNRATMARVLELAEEQGTTAINWNRITYKIFGGHNSDDTGLVLGYLEAAGKFGDRVTQKGATFQQMIAGIARLRHFKPSEAAGPRQHGIARIVTEITGSGTHLAKKKARFRAWDYMTAYLDRLDGRKSVYTTFVERAADLAREQVTSSGQADPARVAELLFPGEHVMSHTIEAVTYWLRNEGIPLADTAEAQYAADLATARAIQRLFGDDVPGQPQQGETLGLSERLSYAVWKVADMLLQGEPGDAATLAALAFAVETPSERQVNQVRGALEVAGLDFLFTTRTGALDRMGDAFQKVHEAWENGEGVLAGTVAKAVLGQGRSNYESLRFEGWYAMLGLVGARFVPPAPKSFLAKLLDEVRRVTDNGTEGPDGIARGLFGVINPTVGQKAVASELVRLQALREGRRTSTPWPSQISTPRPSQISTPRPSQTTTPRPSQTTTPRPSQTSTPRPSQTSTARPPQVLGTQASDTLAAAQAILRLVGDDVPYKPRGFHSLQQRLDYAVWSAATIVARGARVNLHALARRSFGNRGPEIRLPHVRGALQAAGLDGVLGPSAEVATMDAAYQKMHDDLGKGLKPTPYTVAQALGLLSGGTGINDLSLEAMFVRMGLSADGLKPPLPGSIPAKLLAEVIGQAATARAENRPVDAAELARRTFGVTVPSAGQIAVIAEFLRIEAELERLRGLAEQLATAAAIENRPLDVYETARQVFGIEFPEAEHTRQVTDWLAGFVPLPGNTAQSQVPQPVTETNTDTGTGDEHHVGEAGFSQNRQMFQDLASMDSRPPIPAEEGSAPPNQIQNPNRIQIQTENPPVSRSRWGSVGDLVEAFAFSVAPGEGNAYPLDEVAQAVWTDEADPQASRSHRVLIEHSALYRDTYGRVRDVFKARAEDPRGMAEIKRNVKAAKLDSSVVDYWLTRLRALSRFEARLRRTAKIQDHPAFRQATEYLDTHAPAPQPDPRWGFRERKEIEALRLEEVVEIAELIAQEAPEQDLAARAARIRQDIGLQ